MWQKIKLMYISEKALTESDSKSTQTHNKNNESEFLTA